MTDETENIQIHAEIRVVDPEETQEGRVDVRTTDGDRTQGLGNAIGMLIHHACVWAPDEPFDVAVSLLAWIADRCGTDEPGPRNPLTAVVCKLHQIITHIRSSHPGLDHHASQDIIDEWSKRSDELYLDLSSHIYDWEVPTP